MVKKNVQKNEEYNFNRRIEDGTVKKKRPVGRPNEQWRRDLIAKHE